MTEKLQAIARAWGIPLEDLLRALVKGDGDDGSSYPG